MASGTILTLDQWLAEQPKESFPQERDYISQYRHFADYANKDIHPHVTQ